MIVYRETLPIRLRIADAQPREEMVGELFDQIQQGSPWVTINGDVLTIWDDYGHRYIYRVIGYDVERDVHLLEWPD